jgi:hypothetical protein
MSSKHTPGPIPARLHEEFKGWMSIVYDDDDLPGGAWFALLEEHAGEFMRTHKLRGDTNDAAHQALQLLGDAA